MSEHNVLVCKFSDLSGQKLSPNFSISEIDFEAIYEIWRTKLWPNKKSAILATSSLEYNGTYDITLHKNTPIFYALMLHSSTDDTKKIIGVISGLPTNNFRFRCRGLYIHEEYRHRGYAQLLLRQIALYAANSGHTCLWSLPRVSALKTYQNFGFKQVSAWPNIEMDYGPNLLAVYDLLNLKSRHE